MAEERKAEVKRVQPDEAKAVPKDKSMHGGARGGDAEAHKDPEENREPPIVQRTA
jgi:hypothetical protein